MADVARGGTFERDIEQAIVALKRGAYLLKYGRKGKPRFCPFRLSADEKSLIWYSGKEEMQLSLSSVSRIVPGQRTANFQRNPQPEKEYQSFSLIYGHDDQSLDLICKDKEQAELWFIGIKALISESQACKMRVDIKKDGPLPFDESSPIGYLRRKFTLGSALVTTSEPHQQDFVDMYRAQRTYGSPPQTTLSTATLYSLDSRKSYPDSISLGDSLHSTDSGLGSESLKPHSKDNGLEAFRVSLSSVISSSSQGSTQDDPDALGDVYMWGEGIGDGILGGGGYRVGNMAGSHMDALLPRHLESAVVLNVQNIACGIRHAALVNRQGEVFCWGEELGGRLGHGIDADVPHPQLVETLESSNTGMVACGEYHTCAITLSGELYSWGDGSRGLGFLGHGNEISHWLPRRVTFPEEVRVSSVACGPWHTAIVTSAGQMFTFGDGTFGVLGHGDRKSLAHPREVESLKGLKAIRVACGPWHTAAVVEVIRGFSGGSSCSSGKLFTWGDGDKGCLGHGEKESKLVPTCVAALVDYDFHQVACGHSLTVALTTSGQVYTMGSCIHGQLGHSQAGGELPDLVEGKLLEAFVEEIACGAYHVAVLTSKIDVYTWGKGANGRLGHGDVQDRHTPTLVEALKGKQVKNIACGSSFTAAICLHKLFSGMDQSVCTRCRMPFVFTRKRHNCYNCGHAFCHACSNKKAIRATLAPTSKKPHRVCDPCYFKLKAVTEAGVVAQSEVMRKHIMKQQLVETKQRQEISEAKHCKAKLPTPRFPLLEHSKHGDGRTLSKQSKKHESLRRVSPAPIDLISWGHISMPSISEPSCAIVKAPMSPFSIVSSRNHDLVSLPFAWQSSPPQLTNLRETSSGFCSHDFAINELQRKNKALSEQVLKLQKEVEIVTQRCQAQEAELQCAVKEIQEWTLLAGEEAAKCRAAKEVIKSLTGQIKGVASKMPTRMCIQNGVDHSLSPKFVAQKMVNPLAVSNSIAEKETQLQLHDYEDTFNQTVQTVRDSESNGMPSPYAAPNGALNLLSQSLARQLTPRLEEQERLRDNVKWGNTSVSRNGHHLNHQVETEWVQQDDPGVYITFTTLPGHGKDLKRVRFSRKKFSEKQAEQWWSDNRARVYEQYNVCGPDSSGWGAMLGNTSGGVNIS